MDLQFLNKHLFTDEYQRNNKAKGRKNLRCFPACREHGHVDTGYCGRPVTVELNYNLDPVRNLDLVAFAEFRPYDREAAHNVSVGQAYDYDDILNCSRGNGGAGQSTDQKAPNPWFPGSITDSDTSSDDAQATFAFNQTNQR